MGLRVTCTAAPGVYLISKGEDTVATVMPERAGAGRELADAMAAAPDLLEAATFARAYFANIPASTRLSEQQKALNLLADAIARAKGTNHDRD